MLVFVICQSFTIVADVYEALHCVSQDKKYSLCYSNDHIENIIDIAHFMLSINSSINFLLYVIHDKIFRDALIKVRQLHIYMFIYHDLCYVINCQQYIMHIWIFIGNILWWLLTTVLVKSCLKTDSYWRRTWPIRVTTRSNRASSGLKY